MGGEVPQRGEDDLEGGLLLGVAVDALGGLHGQGHEHGDHAGLGEHGLGGLVGLPGEVAEDVGRVLAHVDEGRAELLDHDGDEAIEVAEVLLDARVPEGQVGEGHARQASDLGAGGLLVLLDRFEAQFAVQGAFDLFRR